MDDSQTDINVPNEIANGVINLFNQISNFINSIMQNVSDGATISDDSTMSDGNEGQAENSIASASEGETEGETETKIKSESTCSWKLGDPVGLYAKFKYIIIGNTNIILNIPTNISSYDVIFPPLNNNNVLVQTFNETHREQISMIQYRRFDSSIETPINCLVIHLIINVNDKDIQNVYICVKYNKDGSLDSKNVCVYNNYDDYSQSDFRNVVLPETPTMERTSRSESAESAKYIVDLQMMVDEEKLNCPPQTTQVLPINQQTPSSKYSPARSFATEYDKLSVSARMFDMYAHGVEGLGKIAEKRYNKDIGNLATIQADTKIGTIKEQIESKLESKKTQIDRDIKCAQAVNDLIDMAHDFRTISEVDFEYYIGIVSRGETPDFEKKLRTRLFGLLSSSGNINVAKSHELQKANIDDLIAELRKNGIIFPDIPAEKYISRMQVFAEFIADMMTPKSRSNYTESGKQVIIDTFKAYYKLLDDSARVLFKQRVMHIMGDGVRACASAVPTATIDVVANIDDKDGKHPSIPKLIMLDGCRIGKPAEYDDVINETITNVYGIFNVNIVGNNNKGFIIKISNSKSSDSVLLELEVPKGELITYDDVANYMNKKLRANVANRGTIKDYKDFYNKIRFTNDADSDNFPLKRLLLQCLKTFCDKIYRTSMEFQHSDDTLASGITHTGTTDSYFYADLVLQYLAGLAKSIPTTMRSGDDVLGAGNKSDTECNDEENIGRGSYINPGVNDSNYVDTSYENILRKTLGYACFLQNLANECCPSENTMVNDSQSQASSTPALRMTDVFRLKTRKLFDTSDNALGKLVDANIRSERLLNFVERFQLNYGNEVTDTQMYEREINQLFQLECTKVIENVKAYVANLQEIMKQNTTTEIKKIKEKIIKLPDLEKLLRMSTPEFWYENDDTLLLEPDKPLIEEMPLFLDSDDSLKEEMPLYHSHTTNGHANTKKQPTFESVEFDSDTLIISGVSDSFKHRQKFQLIKQYKIENIDNITGPITLDLLYTLKKYTTSPKIVDDIDNKIDEIINEFRSSCNIVDVATQGDNKVSTWRKNTSSKGSDIPGALKIMANMRETAELIPRVQTYLLNPDGSEDKPARSVMAGQMHTPTGSDNDDVEMSDTSPRISDEERLEQERLEQERLEQERLKQERLEQERLEQERLKQERLEQERLEQERLKQERLEQERLEQERLAEARATNAVQIKRPRSTGSNGGRSTRKRKRTKIPRQTIRRRATRRGQKRTIRRQRRNKKGTQKRRK